MLFGMEPFLPELPAIWDSGWVVISASAISAADVALWPYTPGLLVKWVSFIVSLHWPAGGSDLLGWWYFLFGASYPV